MIIVCAWCQQVLGVKAPEDDLAVSHGICRTCSERAVPLDLETGTVARAAHPSHDPQRLTHPPLGSPRASHQH